MRLVGVGDYSGISGTCDNFSLSWDKDLISIGDINQLTPEREYVGSYSSSSIQGRGRRYEYSGHHSNTTLYVSRRGEVGRISSTTIHFGTEVYDLKGRKVADITIDPFESPGTRSGNEYARWKASLVDRACALAIALIFFREEPEQTDDGETPEQNYQEQSGSYADSYQTYRNGTYTAPQDTFVRVNSGSASVEKNSQGATCAACLGGCATCVDGCVTCVEAHGSQCWGYCGCCAIFGCVMLGFGLTIFVLPKL